MPIHLSARIIRQIVNRFAFDADTARYNAMSGTELFAATTACLRNLPRVDAITAADGCLQVVLVPELWDRISPGTRYDLRRISSTLAEYAPDPKQPSIFERLLTTASRERLRTSAKMLRQSIAHAASLSTMALVEWTRFAIAGSRAVIRHAPDDCVYEPAFAYRLAPAIAQRALDRDSSDGKKVA